MDAGPNLVVQIDQLDAAIHDERLRPTLRLTLIDDLLGGALVLEHLDGIACARKLNQAEDLDREARIRATNAFAAVVEHRLDATPGAASNHDVAHVERAALNEQRCHRAAIAVNLGLDHDAARELVRICFELVDVGNQEDHFEQIVQTRDCRAQKPRRMERHRPSLPERHSFRKAAA